MITDYEKIKQSFITNNIKAEYYHGWIKQPMPLVNGDMLYRFNEKGKLINIEFKGWNL